MNQKTYEVPYIYEKIQANPSRDSLGLSMTVPGSKSITNRALLLATLADGVSFSPMTPDIS